MSNLPERDSRVDGDAESEPADVAEVAVVLAVVHVERVLRVSCRQVFDSEHLSEQMTL